MNIALFIDETTLKERSFISVNVESALLIPAILSAQNIRILPLLGTDLFNKLASDILANTVTGNYSTLYESYIKPCMVEWVQYELLPYLDIKLMNKNVAQETSQNSQPVDIDSLKYLRQNTQNKAEFYSQRIIDYLCENSSLFPEYSTNSGADIQPKTKAFYGGIYLKGGCNYSPYHGKCK